MPIYEYQCEGCKQQFEVIQKITDAPLLTCEVCGETLRKLVSSTSFILKGGGWYATEYGNKGKKNDSDAGPASAGATGSAGTASGDKKEAKDTKEAKETKAQAAA